MRPGWVADPARADAGHAGTVTGTAEATNSEVRIAAASEHPRESTGLELAGREVIGGPM